MRVWPNTLTGRLSLWAFVLFLISIPLLWLAFLSGATRISENVVDTQILDFATQLRGYRAAAITAQRLEPASATAVSDEQAVQQPSLAPILVGDTDWIWQISSNGSVEARSDFLALSQLVLPDEIAKETDAFVMMDIQTEAGNMRVAARAIAERSLDQIDTAEPRAEPKQNLVHYITGMSEDRYQDQVAEHQQRLQDLVFIGVAPISIGILGMLAFVVFTLRQTFRNLEHAILDYETSGAAEISGTFPTEIQNLVSRTNDILRQNNVLIDRTRKYVSKIAHDINHPLAILKNALRGELDPKQANRQIARMSGLIDRYASLARAIGPDTQTRRAVEIAPVLADIADGFQILYRRTPLSITTECEEALTAIIPRHDVETMISNLVSNAHKYANSRTHISAKARNGGLELVVEDDGPGVPEEERAAALNWGQRLDEAPPGTGFGLSIVCDIATLYAGTVSLDSSDKLGGLKALIFLPIPTSDT